MNPINYAFGLLETYAVAVNSGVKARESEARELITWVSGELDALDADSLTADARELYDTAKAAVADVLAKPKRAAKAAEPTA
jgi:hypothetical protein